MRPPARFQIQSWVGFESTVFATSPAAAPILRPTTEGPLSFGLSTWGERDVRLPIGQAEKVYLTVGNTGSGSETLSALTEHFLVPGKDRIHATLVAKGADGKEVTSENEIRGRC